MLPVLRTLAPRGFDAFGLKRRARHWGASLVGVADLERLRGIETEPADLLSGFSRAVSLAVRLSDPVLDAVTDRPTPLYAQHYQKVNALLDDFSEELDRYPKLTALAALGVGVALGVIIGRQFR